MSELAPIAAASSGMVNPREPHASGSASRSGRRLPRRLSVDTVKNDPLFISSKPVACVRRDGLFRIDGREAVER